ncbi:MAG: zinc-binding dehydrogenase [Candidatus Binatia bacterium]
MMKHVVVCGPNDVRVVDTAKPEPGPHDVVIQVAACGVCGSDLHYIGIGGMPLFGAGAMPLGHEVSGVVHAVGERVPDVRVGQRVIVRTPAGPNNAIGSGGPGALAEYLLVRNVTQPAIDFDGRRFETYLYPLPDTWSFQQGALVEPLAVGWHAADQSGAQPGEKVVVLGAGPIGLAAIVALRHRGVNDVIALDLSPVRLALAERVGASAAVNAAHQPWEAVRERYGQEMVHGRPALGADAYIDTTGSERVMRDILDQAKFRARVVVVAVYGNDVSLPFMHVMAKELVLKGSMSVGHDFAKVIDMLASGRVDVVPMITHEFDFAHVMDAFAAARQTDTTGKVMVNFLA